MSRDVIDFETLEPIFVNVIGPKPNRTKYVLVEASADSVAKFNDHRGRCVRFSNGEMAGVEGQGDSEMFLVSLCLFEVTEKSVESQDWEPDPTKPVSLERLMSWPGRMVSRLYKKAIEISEIDLEMEDIEELINQRNKLNDRIQEMTEQKTVKNESPDMVTGSS